MTQQQQRQQGRFREALAIAIREALAVYVAENLNGKANIGIVNEQRHAISSTVAEHLSADFRMKRFARILDTKFRRTR